MWLQTAAGTWTQITAIDTDRKVERVHNLTVADTHTYHVGAGNESALTHNCGETRIDYDSEELSSAAFEARDRAGFYGADHNVSVARVEGRDELVVGFSRADGKHAEADILDQLGPKEKVLGLYTEHQPCKDVCAPHLAADERMKGAAVTYSVPWASGPDAGTINPAAKQLLKKYIESAKTRKGLTR